MILVAFVLVLVATVTLIIGTFFDAGVEYIWISIGACVATFGVLAASYWARRRGEPDEAARPEPLVGSQSRSAPTRSAARSAGGGTATATREEPQTDAGAPEEHDDTTITIVPGSDEAADTPEPASEEPTAPEWPAAAEQPAADDDEEEAPAAAPAPQPQPRRVAPRRVVRAEPAAAADEPAAANAAGTAAAASTDEDAQEAASATRRVVRRAQPSEGTRRVVRRAAGSGGTRRVVRRSAAAGGEQRTVKRVIRRAQPASAAAESAPEQKAKASNRSGTRGKRARAVLSEIKGVGPAKQDALLKKFGSLENMAEASVEELAAVKGVGESVAATIKQTLQDR